MPWGYSKETTLPSLRNKSLEVRKLFAEVANEAIDKGRSEDEAITAGLSSVSALERKKAKDVKKSLELEESVPEPLHLKVLKEAAEQKRNERLQNELRLNEEFRSKVMEVVKGYANPSSITSLYFDSDGKLVVVLSDGKTVKSKNSVAEEVLNQFTTVVTEGTGSPPSQNISELNDVSIDNLQNGDILKYDSTSQTWKNSQSPILETNPVFTYASGNLSRIDYDSGNYKLFFYTVSRLDRIDYFKGSVIYRKELHYDIDGNLINVTDSILP